jgi:hypothetical protein
MRFELPPSPWEALEFTRLGDPADLRLGLLPFLLATGCMSLNQQSEESPFDSSHCPGCCC